MTGGGMKTKMKKGANEILEKLENQRKKEQWKLRKEIKKERKECANEFLERNEKEKNQ